MSSNEESAAPPFTALLGAVVVSALTLVLVIVCKQRQQSQRVSPMVSAMGASAGQRGGGAATVPIVAATAPTANASTRISVDAQIAAQLGQMPSSAWDAAEEQALQLAVEASYRSSETDVERQRREAAEAEAAEAALQASVRARLQKFPLQSWSIASGGRAEEEECSLCMESFAMGGDEDVRALGCRHYFHALCIDKWLITAQQGKTRSCPICQTSIFKNGGGETA